MLVPLFDPDPVLRRAERCIEANLAALRSAGRYILGEQVAAFETELAQAFGGTHAIGAGTGTAALELCLRHAGLRGSEVIVPGNTSLFTAQAVLAAGATLRFADVDPRTLLLTAETASRAWTAKTRAVIAVHLFGHGCDLEPLAGLCRERNAVLVQDACQAHGLRIGGRPLTDFSPYTAYSFYPTKNLGCLGDGGAIVTNTSEIAQSLSMLRDGGRQGDQLARFPAINSRLDEMHAAYLRAFLPHLTYWTDLRRRAAAAYKAMLEGCPGVRLLPYTDAVHHLYVIRVADRDGLSRHLQHQGIQSAIHYPHPLHVHPAFQNVQQPRLPVAESASREILSLPIGPHVTEEIAQRVAGEVVRYCSK